MHAPLGTESQKPASAPPRTCRTAPTDVLRVEGMLRTSLSAGRRRATLIRQAAPSPWAKATIGAMRGAWRLNGGGCSLARKSDERASANRTAEALWGVGVLCAYIARIL